MESENRKELTLSQRFKLAVRDYLNREQDNASLRQDSADYQKNLLNLIREFQLIKTISESLTLFSDNETLEEVNTSYIPFFNVEYYLGMLHLSSLSDSRTGALGPANDLWKFKEDNLVFAKENFIGFLNLLNSYSILNKSQLSKLKAFKDSYNPTTDEILKSYGNPATRRHEKIENHKIEKELTSKISILNQYYNLDENNDNPFAQLDNEVVREIYLDQSKLYSIKAFSELELISMELQVIESKPVGFSSYKIDEHKRSQRSSKDSDIGYTTKVEHLPMKSSGIRDMISRQGKILQPFVINTDRDELKAKVFGTGQVLPSMTVEEYLDYELANGKMFKDTTQTSKGDDEETDSDEEIERRQWDDWKDENPKGSGNMKANIG